MSPEPKHSSTARSPQSHQSAPVGVAPAQPSRFSPEITSADLRVQAEWLSAEAREGRMTGSDGARAAADWLAAELSKAGLKSPQSRSDGSLFHSFEFNAGVKVLPGKNELSISGEDGTSGQKFELEKDLRPLAFSDNGEVE